MPVELQRVTWCASFQSFAPTGQAAAKQCEQAAQQTRCTQEDPCGCADLTLAWRGQTPLHSATRKGHTDVVRVLQAAAAAGAGRSLQCAPRQQLVSPQPHVPVVQHAANAVLVESASHGLQRAEWGAAAAEPWADDARRCQLLLLDICEGRSAEVGRGTREALQETARVLGQWIA